MTDHINDNDVLFGRGGATNNHNGNKKFRVIVTDHQPEYVGARKKDKAIISKRIVRLVREKGGRFLRRDASSGLWIEVGDKKASEKTSQALREGLDVRAQASGKSPRRPSKSSPASTDGAPGRKRRRAENTLDVTLSPTTVNPTGEVTIMPDLEEEIPRMMPSFVLHNAPAPVPADCDNVAEI